MKKDEAIIFDLDGTITDTFAPAVKCLKEALNESVGREVTMQEIRAHFGRTEEAAFRAHCGANWRESYARYEQLFNKNITEDVIFPGMKDVFNFLKDNKIKTALVTGRGKTTTDIILNKIGIRDYFDYIKTGSAFENIKTKSMLEILDLWKQAPEKTYYIGDIPNDITDSHAAGIKALAAGWFREADPYAQAAQNPYKMFATVAEFFVWIKQN